LFSTYTTRSAKEIILASSGSARDVPRVEAAAPGARGAPRARAAPMATQPQPALPADESEPAAVAAALAERPDCRVAQEKAVRLTLRGGEGTREVSRSWWLQCPGEPRRLVARDERSAPVGAGEAAGGAIGGGGGIFGGGGGMFGGGAIGGGGGGVGGLDLDELLRDFLRNGRRVPAPDGGAPSAAARLGRNGGMPV